ncbi:MAG: TrkH family potassium uptake protein [Candidatus Methanomethylophilaceae archaeon]|jgi:trk system potassium uptake protein TrkH|nr:TrkH family potassium uptake protein [Candidatus Methanomethylophilaceae archaeon]NLF33875.1 TrkH family potassium uptake protein [Thermoplasmatales archaeon]
MRFKIDRSARWEGPTVHLVGIIVFGISVSLAVPVSAAVLLGEDPLPFAAPMAFCLCASLLMMSLFRMHDGPMKAVDGLIMIGCAWLAAVAIGVIPYIMFGMPPADAIFESASGFTTTGSTIMSDIESWPRSLLLWRSMTQWVGGIATILIFLFLMPMLGFGGRTFFNNELSGSGSRNFTARMADAAKHFAIIYGALSVVLLVTLVVLGVDIYESLCMMFSTVSTGGFMCTNDSLAGYGGLVQSIVILFMLLGGTNFYLHYKAIYKRDPRSYFRSSEFVMMVLWFLLASAIIFVLLGAGGLEQYKDVLFTVVSLGTSTGFATVDYSLWAGAAIAVILAVMLVGGSSGSTAGGIKVGRLLIVHKYILNGLNALIHPRAIYDVKVDGDTVEKDYVSSAVIVFMLFLGTIMVSGIVLAALGMGIQDAFVSAITAICNVGPALGPYGPYGSFAELDDVSKVFMGFIMWVGRLEIATALVMLTPGFWKEYVMGHNTRASRLRKVFFGKRF